MAETSTIFGFMKYVSATDILSDFKKTVDSHFVNSLKRRIINSALCFEYIKIDRDKSTFKSHRDFNSEKEISFKHF